MSKSKTRKKEKAKGKYIKIISPKRRAKYTVWDEDGLVIAVFLGKRDRDFFIKQHNEILTPKLHYELYEGRSIVNDEWPYYQYEGESIQKGDLDDDWENP